MEYKWLTEDQIEAAVNPALKIRGMAQLNTSVARVLGAFEGDTLISFVAVQLFPILGPLLKTDNQFSDDGTVSRELVSKMHTYLDESNVRGVLVVADSPLTSRLCERHGMSKLESPVYITKDRTLECNDYNPIPGVM